MEVQNVYFCSFPPFYLVGICYLTIQTLFCFSHMLNIPYLKFTPQVAFESNFFKSLKWLLKDWLESLVNSHILCNRFASLSSTRGLLPWLQPFWGFQFELYYSLAHHLSGIQGRAQERWYQRSHDTYRDLTCNLSLLMIYQSPAILSGTMGCSLIIQ